MRAALFFALLGLIALALLLRLSWLQICRAPHNRSQVESQRRTSDGLPAPRGTIVDRHGELLAFDRRVIAVRAEAYVTLSAGRSRQDFDDFARALAADLSSALALDPELDAQQRALAARIGRCAPPEPPGGAGAAASRRHKVDFLVAPAVESAAVAWRLSQIDERRPYLYLHYAHEHRRTYPWRDVTIGPVGLVGERDLGQGRSMPVHRGMEAFAGLVAGAGGERGGWRDVVGARFWTAELRAPAPPAVLETTLDLALQQRAQDELQRAADAVTEAYGTPPSWGALCLAEIETGDVLAMASYRFGADPAAAAFSPIQCLCPPGSVVKPLLFAIALERGVLDWDEPPIDCRPTGADGWKVPGVSRWIKDSHTCGELSPREILVQSSNIGAVKVGQRLGREGLIEYLERFGLGETTGTRLPSERAGVVEPGIDRLRTLPERQFAGYAGPSLSFGYGCNLPPIQVLRAYLTLLSGRPRELRLYRRIAAEGRLHELPPAPPGERFLSSRTLALLVDAMRGVVSEAPEATGRYLAEELERLGVPGAVAGKTGTSEYDERRGGRRVMTRTASFAGFAPVERPKFVAICVLQKPEADHFWGGRYAAPAAGRLLLRALSSPPPRRPAMPQVSVGSPEGVGLPAQQR